MQIRGIDIAERIGCDICFEVSSAADIPLRYSKFICVKANSHPEFLDRLAKRGPIIWDVIDHYPPTEWITVLLTSTRYAQEKMKHITETELIRHHHCNFSDSANNLSLRTVGWVGHKHWKPEIDGVEALEFDSGQLNQKAIISGYRTIGICLNLRKSGTDSLYHAEYSSGIKLINSIGFRIPSISSVEVGYSEIGDGCTIYADDNNKAGVIVKRLIEDRSLYMYLRKNCDEAAALYNIDKITHKYRVLLKRV